MNSKIIFCFLVLAILTACQTSDRNQKSDIVSEIEALKTDAQKIVYLENILDKDQEVRSDEEEELAKSYGAGSKEYKKYIDEQWAMDSINLIKIEHYLAIHGYPNHELGKDAKMTPWIVIHHAKGYAARERNFEVIYEAYLNEYINDSFLSGYLDRMYFLKHFESFRMKGPYNIKDEIDQLIEVLDLGQMKENAIEKIKNEN